MDKTNSKMRINEYGNKVWENSKGQWHRLDGPVYEWADGYKFWYINNISLEKKEFNSWIKRIQKCI